MHKRPSYQIKEKIPNVIKETPATYAQLERKVNTGFRTIKANCKELELFGRVTISGVKEHPANGKPSFNISITPRGIELLKKREKTK